ncbi:MAG: GNAT family N-acetyltransferase [Candidatus Obscuribacterales bacterium]|nr:GNAT family N-acetyltransferase [Candidatus Obscuribacterales bacterium]
MKSRYHKSMLHLETERLSLREFIKSDWKAVHEYACDPEVVRYLEWGPNTADETVGFLDGTIACQRERPRRVFEFAVVHKAENKLIGGCGIRVNELDNELGEVGYCFNRNYWGQGFASEAAWAVIEFGFISLALHRVYATCDANNIGSATVLSKCKMRKEGHFLKDKKVRGIWRDTMLFALLKEEWLAIKAKEQDALLGSAEQK